MTWRTESRYSKNHKIREQYKEPFQGKVDWEKEIAKAKREMAQSKHLIDAGESYRSRYAKGGRFKSPSSKKTNKYS